MRLEDVFRGTSQVPFFVMQVFNRSDKPLIIVIIVKTDLLEEEAF